jgi:hypothetical protein
MITVFTADGNTPPKLLKPEQNGRSRNMLYLGGAGESSQMLQMRLHESFCDDMKLRLLGTFSQVRKCRRLHSSLASAVSSKMHMSSFLKIG